MTNFKIIYKVLDTFFLSIWGLTLIDLIPFIASNNIANSFTSIDTIIKTLMALIGFIYFIVTIPHKLKMQKLDRKIKQEELEKITVSNNEIDIKNRIKIQELDKVTLENKLIKNKHV